MVISSQPHCSGGFTRRCRVDGRQTLSRHEWHTLAEGVLHYADSDHFVSVIIIAGNWPCDTLISRYRR